MEKDDGCQSYFRTLNIVNISEFHYSPLSKSQKHSVGWLVTLFNMLTSTALIVTNTCPWKLSLYLHTEEPLQTFLFGLVFLQWSDYQDVSVKLVVSTHTRSEQTPLPLFCNHC